MDRFSNITIRGNNESKEVKISSKLKPEIQQDVIDKWQSLIDTAARIAKVPSGLIMRLNEKTIEVFLKSNTDGNPYEKGEEAKLIYGLYCETVIGSKQKLLIPDATKSNLWKRNNPDVDINMISYLGYPLNWPDGEVFGTVCLLDNKENSYHSDFENLLDQIKSHIENDLEILLLNHELKEKNHELQQTSNIKSKFLSLISHDIRGGIGTINEFVKMIMSDMDNLDSSKLKPVFNALSQNISSSYETIENLLTWSKNDILQLEPKIKLIDIVDVVENVLIYFKQPIEIKNIKVVKSYDSSRALINSDENMLTVIIRNLISNAIKYNRKNGEINIKVLQTNGSCQIEITDTGIGMSEDTLCQLFKYNEKHTKGTQGESSAGIGLILTKEFLDKLHAKIAVDSELNKGSKFMIEINNYI